MKKNKKILLLISFVLSIFVFDANIVKAQDGAINSALDKLDIIGNETGFGETKTDVGLYDKIADVINIALGFAGIIATILIIVAGTKWIMAGGNEEEITKAKGTIKGSVIGIGIVLASYIVVNFIVIKLIEIFTNKSI